jgi:hypothetical protein
MTEPLPELPSDVAAAIADLAHEFGVTEVESTGDGGAYVKLNEIEIGPRWQPTHAELSFLVPFNFPYAYIYPFYTDQVLTRADGGDQPNALQRVNWRGRDVTQISLRPNRWQPQYESASSLVYLVQHWFHVLA